jgi:DNA-binding beta-propeller fold protein YncE
MQRAFELTSQKGAGAMTRRAACWRQIAPVIGLLIAAVAPLATGQERDPKYPHVNTAVAYRVDPHWPQKPSDLQWGAVSGIAVDDRDQVYVFTRSDDPVQVYDGATGKLVRTWGRGVVGSAHHIKIDPEGNVWVADIGLHVVQKCTPEGKVLLTLGTPGKAGRDRTHMNQPTDMAITKDGDIFVSDGYGNARVVHFDKDGKYVKDWGELGSRAGQFSIPHAIGVDSKGQIYVADRNNVRVQVFDRDGKLLDVWNNILVPWGICVTKDDGIWICGSSPMQWRKTDGALGCPPKDQVFMKFNGQGKLAQLWTVPKGMDGLERPGECNWVHAIATDSKGNLYVGDIIGKRAQKFVRVGPEGKERASR